MLGLNRHVQGVAVKYRRRQWKCPQISAVLLCGFSIGQANLVLFTSFELSGKYSGITHSVILLHIEPINVQSFSNRDVGEWLNIYSPTSIFSFSYRPNSEAEVETFTAFVLEILSSVLGVKVTSLNSDCAVLAQSDQRFLDFKSYHQLKQGHLVKSVWRRLQTPLLLAPSLHLSL